MVTDMNLSKYINYMLIHFVRCHFGVVQFMASSALRSERASLNRKVWNLPSIREKLKDKWIFSVEAREQHTEFPSQP